MMKRHTGFSHKKKLTWSNTNDVGCCHMKYHILPHWDETINVLLKGDIFCNVFHASYSSHFLPTHELPVIVQKNDCSQMLLIECSPLPPTQSCAAWIVLIDVCLTGSPEREKLQKLTSLCITRLSLCPCLLFYSLGGNVRSKSFSQVKMKTSNYSGVGEELRQSEFGMLNPQEEFEVI